jgi:hypothetical protein
MHTIVGRGGEMSSRGEQESSGKEWLEKNGWSSGWGCGHIWMRMTVAMKQMLKGSMRQELESEETNELPKK